MTLYSHSRLASFENCPRRFRYRYIDQIETESEGIEAFVGKRVHEILERLYHHVARHGRPPSLSQVHDRFRKDWLLHWHEQIEIVRTENDVEHYRSVGSRCLENYYRAQYPFDEGHTVGIEQPLQLSLDAAGRYRMRGIADRIVRRHEGRWEIHDYKTSGYLPPRRRIEQDRQLAIYQIGLEQTYDGVREVELIWHYLIFNRTITSRRSREQLDALRSDTIELIDRIEKSSEYPAVPGPLCRWCEFKGICPDARADARSDAATEPGSPEPPPLGELSAPPRLEAPPPPAQPEWKQPVQLSLL